MVVVLAGLFMGCPTLLSPSICYVMYVKRTRTQKRLLCWVLEQDTLSQLLQLTQL